MNFGRKKPSKSCNLEGSSFKFSGYSYLMLATSINERSAELATHTDIHLKG
jgi:hypothetical protein